jgi:hypothetical protein
MYALRMSDMPNGIAIQPRDLELLRLLLHTRILTLKHVAALVFDGSKEAAKKRVQKLKAAGLVLERRRKAYESGILFLPKRGFECLSKHGALPEECADIASFSKRVAISELTLRHELEVLDVKVAFHEATKNRDDLSLAEFSTWPRLYEFSVRDDDAPYSGVKTVKPDGYIRIHEKDAEGTAWEHLFFLEIDRSTEKLETLVQKAICYNRFYREGGMAARFGKTAEEFKDFPFRVLIVCKSKERRDNIAMMLLHAEPRILTQVCLSTLKEVCDDPLGQVWRHPADYANGTVAHSAGTCILEIQS